MYTLLIVIRHYKIAAQARLTLIKIYAAGIPRPDDIVQHGSVSNSDGRVQLTNVVPQGLGRFASTCAGGRKDGNVAGHMASCIRAAY